MDWLAIVPARAGSERVPNKNLRKIAGKTLVAHAVECAQLAGASTVIVSSDSEEILRKGMGVHGRGSILGLLRPPELATSTAQLEDVVRHVYEVMSDVVSRHDVVCLMQPTSPLRAPWSAWSVVEAAAGCLNGALSVSRACERAFHGTIGDDGEWVPGDAWTGPRPRTQDSHGLVFTEAGGMWAWRRDMNVLETGRPRAGACAVPIPWWEGWDIDTKADLCVAELLWPLRGTQQ